MLISIFCLNILSLRRFALAGICILYAGTLPASTVPFASFQTTPESQHPLIDQLDTSAAIVPWSGPEANDILMVSSNAHYFGARTLLFRQISRDERGLPLYDSGTTLAGLEGVRMQPVKSHNGLFDLVSQQDKSGKSDFIQYINNGSLGNPDFSLSVPVLLDGKAPGHSLNQNVLAWSLDDMDGDEVPDLLMAVMRRSGKYQIGGSMWSGKELEDLGPGRGYDLQGKWLGGDITSSLIWAKGARDKNGIFSFSNPMDIYYSQKGFRAQLKTWEGNRAVRYLKLGGKGYILLAGDIDRLLAMQLTWDEGEAIVGSAVSVKAGDAGLEGTYFVNNISVLEHQEGGETRLMLDGNPGRLIVLAGMQPEAFVEVGALHMAGGELAVDTLATPVRFDWDADGYPDLVIGDASGLLTYWPGTPDPFAYGEPLQIVCEETPIHHQAGEQGSIQGPVERRWGYIQPTVGDWRGDGQLTIITADINSDLTLYDVTSQPGTLANKRVLTQNGKPLPTAWRSRPAIIPASVDFGGLGRPSLLYLDWDGDLAVAMPAESGGSEIESSQKLHYTDGRIIRLCGPAGLWGRAKIAINDLDGDGDWDVLLGTNRSCVPYFNLHVKPMATVFWLRNDGSSKEPSFRPAEPITLKDGNLIDLGVHNASVWPTDLDGDERTDLIIGAENGKSYYFFGGELEWQ